MAGTIAAKRVKLVWLHGFYDGPLSGVCMVDDALHFFAWGGDIDTHPRTYDVYELTDDEVRRLTTDHILFELYVGVHNCYHLGDLGHDDEWRWPVVKELGTGREAGPGGGRMSVAGERELRIERVCSIGCCAGCQDCYGMSIGCHQDPCRCALPCTCDYSKEEAEPARWRDGCQRHDSKEDTRGEWMRAEPDDDDLAGLSAQYGECPTCGQVGACAYDDQGRALIHATEEDE